MAEDHKAGRDGAGDHPESMSDRADRLAEVERRLAAKVTDLAREQEAKAEEGGLNQGTHRKAAAVHRLAAKAHGRAYEMQKDHAEQHRVD